MEKDYVLMVQNHFDKMKLSRLMDLNDVLDNMVFHEILTWEEVNENDLENNQRLKDYVDDTIWDFNHGRIEF